MTGSASAANTEHHLDDVSPDDEGCWWSACTCSWASEAQHSREDAVQRFADHAAENGSTQEADQ